VRGSMLEIGRAYGATDWQIFSKIRLKRSRTMSDFDILRSRDSASI
jgi:hypothetical protein